MPTARELVRTSVGIAALAPAIALGVLAVVLFRSGGFGGFLSGLLVLALAAALLLVALMATHAPVSIHWMLRRTDDARAARKADAGEAGSIDHSSSSGNGSSGTKSD